MKKSLNLTKMSGSGNNFIVIDNRKPLVSNPSVFAKKYCRREDIDGLLLVEKSLRRNTDFRMVYYNSDGSHAAFCGNGARCIALFAYLNKISSAKMVFESDAGLINAEVKKKSVVKIKMPEPKNFGLDFLLKIAGKKFEASFADTGVPHTVIFVKDIKNVDVEHLGRAIRWHKRFQPSGTNVNFVKVLSRNKLQIRTYERGVEAETLACGTGVVASAIISILKKYVCSPVNVLTQGGETLKIYYNGRTAFFEGKVHYIL
ncbi:MAG: diaminopimelate epimerase [Elusimicrobiota bacterium]